jgi:GT2 family glycosyltransferase
MDLSIAIVNWNTRELLERCLASIYETASGFDFEVFVVDNASTDHSPDMVRSRFPEVQLITNQDNTGFAHANNQAIALSRGRYVLLLNSDTEVQPSALQLLIQALDSQPRAAAAGPQMLNPDGTYQNSYGALPSVLAEIIGPYLFDFITKPWGRIGAKWHDRHLSQDKYLETDRVSFACTLIRREALNQIGALDESFIFYSEDYDWFRRLKDANLSVIFCPQAQVKHFWGASSHQASEWSLRQLYNSKRVYFAKHYGPAAEGVLRIGLMLRFALKWISALMTYPVHHDQSKQQVKLYAGLIRSMLAPSERRMTQATAS